MPSDRHHRESGGGGGGGGSSSSRHSSSRHHSSSTRRDGGGGGGGGGGSSRSSGHHRSSADKDRERDRDREPYRDAVAALPSVSLYSHSNSSRHSTTSSRSRRLRNRDRDRENSPRTGSAISRVSPGRYDSPSDGGAGDGTGAWAGTGLYGLGGSVAAASRYSLTEQFSNTRQEYEFDDADDASVYFCPASEVGPAFDEEEEDEYTAAEFGRGAASESWVSVSRGADGESIGKEEKTEEDDETPSPQQQSLPNINIEQVEADEEKAAENMVQLQTVLPMPIKQKPVKSRGRPLRNAYELFCLPRRHEVGVDDLLWEEQVRLAFTRLAPLLRPDNQEDDDMRELASRYFNDAVKSYEILMSTRKRIEYDADLVEAASLGDFDSLLESLDSVKIYTGRDDMLLADAKCQTEALRQMIHDTGILSVTDLTLRMDAQKELGNWHFTRLQPKDFTLGHAVGMPVPMAPVRNFILRAASAVTSRSLRKKLEKGLVRVMSGRPNADPLLVLSGSVHAPSYSATLGNKHSHTPANVIVSDLTIALQQEIPSSHKDLPPTILAVGVSPLMAATRSFQFSHAFKHRFSPFPLHISGMAVGSVDGPSTVGHADITLHQPLTRARGGGAMWLTINSGDWKTPLTQPKGLSTFTTLSAVTSVITIRSLMDIVQASLEAVTSPQAEVGWTGSETGNPVARPLLPCRELLSAPSSAIYAVTSSSLSRVNCLSHKGKYHLSASINRITGLCISARYRKPLALLYPRFQRMRYSRRIGVELEVTSNPLLGPSVLARALMRTGSSLTHLGLELGSSAAAGGSVHVALRWQRLEQSVSVPILVASGDTCQRAARVTFWLALAPIVASVAWKFAAATWTLVCSRRGQTNAGLLLRPPQPPAGLDTTKDGGEQAHDSQQVPVAGKDDDLDSEQWKLREVVEYEVDRRRGEADLVSALLAPGLLARQKHSFPSSPAATTTATTTENKNHRSGKLNIISAEYGVWVEAADGGGGTWDANVEVCDVTLAVAALVVDVPGPLAADGSPTRCGWLHIPRGMRMARLLGFWDPCPGTRKSLLVRYQDEDGENSNGSEGGEGEEREVRVLDGEGLVLGSGVRCGMRM